ncbi:MAG: translation elongation factor Ts [Fibrobacter sp.]|jgi:elongation factor Ts|nr:translation elongation factor Ts [Fibrobacter sp.]
MQITASMVNELRSKTGVGMMQCKAALTETGGDIDKAVEFLRKQGAAVASKRADKAAKEGRVFMVETSNKAVAFELSCETEPVSKNEDFVALAELAVRAVAEQDITSVEALTEAVVDGVKVGDRLQDVLVKIQENIGFRRLSVVRYGANEVISLYSHMMGKIGVISHLAYEGTPKDALELKQAAKDVAMQIAAFAPIAVEASQVPEDVIQKERDIARALIEKEGKTKPEFVERQVEGKVSKMLKEIVLADQEFFITDKNPNKLSVANYLSEVAKAQGLSSLKVIEFVRFERGN